MSGNKGKGRNFLWLQEHVAFAGNECLLWPFPKNPNGYGQLGYLGKMQWAHRLMCTLAHGEPPAGKMYATHECGNGHLGCVNPRHLSWKTPQQNNLDCRKHGTHVKSRAGSRGKLTAEQVAEIRSLKATMTHDQIAARFNIGSTTVRHIVHGRTHSRPSKIPHYTPEEDQKLREFAAQGLTFTEMARRLNRGVGRLGERAKSLGLKSGYVPLGRGKRHARSNTAST